MTEDWVIRRLHELEDQVKALDARVKELEKRLSREGDSAGVPSGDYKITHAVGTWVDRMIDQHADRPTPPLSPH